MDHKDSLDTAVDYHHSYIRLGISGAMWYPLFQHREYLVCEGVSLLGFRT